MAQVMQVTEMSEATVRLNGSGIRMTYQTYQLMTHEKMPFRHPNTCTLVLALTFKTAGNRFKPCKKRGTSI